MTPPSAALEALKRFGTTIDGHSIWRLIWSDEKLSLGDGQQVREYAHLPGRWILEKWIPNASSPEQWEKTRDPETREYIIGPYTNGSYELAYAFPEGCELGSSIVETIPRLINAGLERFTTSQRRLASRERLERAEKAWAARNSDIWDDSQDAFKGQAFSGAHGHKIRGPEDIRIVLTDKDIAPEFANSRGFRQA